MKRARGLKVLGQETDHNLTELHSDDPPIARTVDGDFYVPVPKKPRPRARRRTERTELGRATDAERDSQVDIEPLEMAEMPLDDNRRRGWLLYRAARTLLGSFTPEPGVPRTRGDCPPERFLYGCSYLSCRAHLWRQDDPPGRPGLSKVPRGAQGRTLSVKGFIEPENAPVVDSAAPWLAHPLQPSCALDVADGGIHGNQALGVVMRRHRTLVARLVRQACASLKAKGHTANDLLRITSPDLRVDAERSRGKSR